MPCLAYAVPDDDDAAMIADAAALRAANINPATGLATDYLNHFNEAIMLLEMVPDMPECFKDFAAWRPLSYAEHFHASNFRGKQLAIRAYETADPAIRADFDAVTDALTAVLVAVADGMRSASRDETRARLAREALGWVKPLVGRAGGIINGRPAQDDIDALLEA